ncbi:MAG: alpha-amylase [Candidatus Vogelbacteria bacterium CG10_big_fil_rev_8_21_14_0_10_45_14]|uniref:Alpha-amylase n=1 Tax=Candidatus Vogelbacteria bacterium CG10_big_fil_rev_8_21_14_0_10_45_14 TaxID=1975042 RepID=A0A2H0RKZ7_9BACT|nr:MAG: alpha-amylase [Candidatus Vogelbacteria bacterium CG10_big_fil_rev_8_21_14_0_10_45_14]
MDIKDSWSRRAVVYQIYPRSFRDSDGDGVGDLQGIIDKLDYLNDGTEDSLGVETIWLSPVYRSPMRDFGYDISDYCDIDPVFGDLLTFDKLVRETKKRDIHIMMDFVPNHTSDQHPWFVESRKSKKSKRRDWYVWADPKDDGSPPNNWLSVFGGSAWTLDEKTNQYYLHHFLKEQPDLNWRNPAVKEAMFDVLRFWIKRGVSGFRTDAIYHLVEDREMRDDPPNQNYVAGRDDGYEEFVHEFTQGREELFHILEEMCYVLAEKGDKFMVTEAYLDIPGMDKVYHACKNGRIAPLNFNLMMIEWGAAQYREFIDRFEATLAPNEWPNYVIGNHDRKRVVSRVGSEHARLLAILQLTLRGMPFIYYGEEIGMRDGEIPEEKRKDIAGVNRDGARTPMQWDNSPNSGFCEDGVSPWLPLSEDWHRKNVEIEESDPHSILSLYTKLIWHRKKSPALLSGSYRSIESGNGYVFAYLRECKEETLLVILNFDDHDQRVHIDFPKSKVVASTHQNKPGMSIDTTDYALHPYEGLVLSTRI